MENNAVQVTVKGIVQGVGFRFFASRRAMYYKLTGYVKNNYDGSVEIWAEGPGDQLNSYILDLRKGPSSAVVEDAEISHVKARGYRSFDIKF